jgi:hypothetical protein
MYLLLVVLLSGLTAALVKLIDNYRGRDKYPPLPTIPNTAPAPIILSPGFGVPDIVADHAIGLCGANSAGLAAYTSSPDCHFAHGSVDYGRLRGCWRVRPSLGMTPGLFARL